jgi:hypothetical protein
MAMGLRKLIFPVALAILWVVLMAEAMVDFAGFDSATSPGRSVAAESVQVPRAHARAHCGGAGEQRC